MVDCHRTNPSRPTFDQLYMETAYVFSKRATCPRLSVGAVLVNDGRIIAASYNGAPRGLPHCFETCSNSRHCLRSVHAEMNCLHHAARSTDSSVGATLYTTHAPCYPCSQGIIQAGVARVVYAEEYRTSSGKRLLMEASIDVEIVNV